MQDIVYRERVFEAVQEMNSFSSTFFTSVLNIVMSGEMKEWSDNVPIGEAHDFDIALLEACEDENVKITTALLKKLYETVSTLCNLNNIEMLQLSEEEDNFSKGGGLEDDDDDEFYDEDDDWLDFEDEPEEDENEDENEDEDDEGDDWFSQNPFLNYK